MKRTREACVLSWKLITARPMAMAVPYSDCLFFKAWPSAPMGKVSEGKGDRPLRPPWYPFVTFTRYDTIFTTEYVMYDVCDPA